MSPAPGPENLDELGARLDEVRRRQGAQRNEAAPSGVGAGFRFATEMVAALVVGGGLGYGIDFGLGLIGVHTKPVFLIVFFLFGAAAGIKNVMSAAQEMNARAARGDIGSAKTGDGEER